MNDLTDLTPNRQTQQIVATSTPFLNSDNNNNISDKVPNSLASLQSENEFVVTSPSNLLQSPQQQTPTTPKHPIQSPKLQTSAWSSLTQFFEYIGLPQYANIFESFGFDMESISAVNDEDLKAMGVSLFGHRKKILMKTSRF